MTKLAYVGGVAVAALLATQAVSYAKDEKPAAAPAAEKKAAAAPAQPAPAAKPEAKAAPAAGAPAKMEPAKPVGEAKPPEAKPMEAPKPAAEIGEVFKQMGGAWKCTGTAGMPPDGHMVPMTFTISFKLDLDKFWIVGTMASKKTKEMPAAYKFTSYTTYDVATKKWVRLMVDNGGGWEEATSTGLTNNQMVWEGKGAGMGMSYASKHTEEMKGPKETHLAGQMSMDGKNWMPMYEATCKK